MKKTDDIEEIIEVLHDHYNLVKLTSFEDMVRNNIQSLSAKTLLENSNTELVEL